MTPTAIADFMAALFTHWPQTVRLLDPGAGIGSLTEAFAGRFLAHAPTVASLDVHCYEIEPVLIGYLSDHLREIGERCRKSGFRFCSTIHDRDFIAESSFEIGMGGPRFTHAILNPPYKKIGTGSDHRKLLRTVGIETVNLYTAFLGLAVARMEHEGEVVAIIPRSFCNGAYFRPFREYLLEHAALTHIHVFESRTHAFKDDEVLQENIIIRLVRGGSQGAVALSTSNDPSFSDYKVREVPFPEIVKPGDPGRFIHIPTLEINGHGPLFSHSLEDLGLEVSTGPVVDFRLREHWLAKPEGTCAPLLYAHHFKGGQFIWPKEHRKPNALRLNDETRKWLMPRGCYAITKRFSSKEERRRLVAYVVDPEQIQYELYGFENHLNVFHSRKNGLSTDLAHGLALFLNSTIVDHYFRNFSGHTQVNATDLRTMRYPSKEMLLSFGKWAQGHKGLTQEQIDDFIGKQNGG
jgi:tRNA1(Val) A37 N6-methylase TrmN6